MQGTHSIPVTLVPKPDGFCDWVGLLALMRTAFTHTVGVVDPASTVYAATSADLKKRAQSEVLLLAYAEKTLVGCLFMRPDESELFLGRFVVSPPLKGSGLARRMIKFAEQEAQQRALGSLALETRIALRENQSKFRALGFETVCSRSHEGYAEPTTLKMVKSVSTRTLLTDVLLPKRPFQGDAQHDRS